MNMLRRSLLLGLLCFLFGPSLALAADFYWVNGAGTWDGSTTTNWASSDGGTGGAGVPTASDNAHFTSLSNATAYTVTMAAGAVCNDLNMDKPASGNITWAGSTALTISGSMTLPSSNLTRTYTGTITFNATATGKTITTNGNTLASSITFNGVGGGWTLGSALNIGSGNITLTRGAFDTGSFNVTHASLTINVTGTSTFSTGTSTFTSSSNWTITNSGSLTMNTGSETANLSNQFATFTGGGYSYGTVSLTNGNNGASVTVSSANTFVNLTVAGGSLAKLLSIAADQTITGTLSIGNTADPKNRLIVKSDVVGTPRTLTVHALTAANVDFRDITGTGAATWSGTSFGDGGGNSGITMTTLKTVYWNLAGSKNFTDVGWATSSGGTPAAANYPIAQDTAIFDNTGAAGTVTVNTINLTPTLDFSARTSAMTVADGAAQTLMGNLLWGTGVTVTATHLWTFGARVPQNFTSNGVSSAGVSFAFGLANLTNTVQLQDNLTSTSTGSINSGTLDFNGKTAQFTTFSLSNTRTLAFGTNGKLTLTGSGSSAFNAGSGTQTVTGTGTISMTSASAKTFAGNGKDYTGVTLSQDGAGTLTISGSNTLTGLTNTVTPATITVTAGTTQTIADATKFTLLGTSGNLVTLQSSSSSAFTLTAPSGTVSADYLSISHSTAWGGAQWYAGDHSTNGGSNTGWIFNAPGEGGGGNFILMR